MSTFLFLENLVLDVLIVFAIFIRKSYNMSKYLSLSGRKAMLMFRNIGKHKMLGKL